MADDFIGYLQKLLPWIGAAATGNVPGLIAMAANTIGGVIGTDVPATTDGIATAIAGIKDPAVMLQLKQAENDFKAKMQQAGFQHEEELRNIELKEEQIFTGDTDAARKTFAANQGVFWLGILTIGAFAAMMGLLLVGCYAILTHGIDVKDPGTVAVVFSLVGTIVGYLASNAQQVYSYFFGSSKGSQDKTAALGDAIKQMAATVGK